MSLSLIHIYRKGVSVKMGDAGGSLSQEYSCLLYTSSCCPAFVNMVRLHYPDLADCVSTTVSPMCAVSRLIKARDPEAVTVFIGPCIAKKSEVVDQQIPGNADYVLTYSEIRAIMKAKSVVLQPAANDDQIASTFGKRFANSGGVTAAVLQSCLLYTSRCV